MRPQRPLLLLCIGIVAALAAPGAVRAAPARVEPVVPCFVTPPKGMDVGADYECGYVVVPEDATAKDGRTVKLGYLRLKARQNRGQAPLFMLAGGAGGSLILPEDFFFFTPRFLGPVLDSRDVVILDQRETRHSIPHLNCPEYSGLARTGLTQGWTEADGIARERAALSRCVSEFRRQGVNLAMYSSVAIAADVDAVRRALGYERIVYYGASYGSQLGQHVMRVFPETLEAVILDGASPLSRKSWIEDRATNVDYSIRHIVALCEADARCKAAYDIPALIERGLAAFDAGPIPATSIAPQAASTAVAG